MDETNTNNTEVSFKPKTKFGGFLDRFFGINKFGTSIARELLGGLVTFFAMFYILNVNSGILSNWFKGYDELNRVWLYGDVYISAADAYAGIFISTALSAGLATIAMGLIGKLPIGLASGMGLNSLISVYLAGTFGFNYAQMMLVVFFDGLLFLIISLTPLRRLIVQAIPKNLKIAISSGIGFFIAFLGLKTPGIIVASSDGLTLGALNNPYILLTLIGIFVAFGLSALPKKNKVTKWISSFAVFIVMIVFGIIEACMGQAGVPGGTTKGFLLESSGSFESFGKIFGACFHGFDVFTKPAAYALIVSLLFVDFFDTTGTFVAVEIGAGMIDKEGKEVVDTKRALVVDAASTVVGAVTGTTTVTSFVESTAGVSAGARTGLAAFTTGVLFMLSIFIYPILGIFSGRVPNVALVYVGACMFMNLKDFDWKEWTSIVSGFVTIAFMVFTASISDGIAFGFISYALLLAFSGKWQKKDLTITILAVAFAGLYLMQFITGIH